MKENIASGRNGMSLSRPGLQSPYAFVMTILLLPMALIIGATLFATVRRAVIERLESTHAERAGF